MSDHYCCRHCGYRYDLCDCLPFPRNHPAAGFSGNQNRTSPKMLDDQQLDAAIAATMAPKVTKDYMESRIAWKEFIRIGATVTLCSLTLDNGYSVRGESACVSPENYKKDIGERIAYDNAFDKLWPLFGFALAEKLYSRSELGVS